MDPGLTQKRSLASSTIKENVMTLKKIVSGGQTGVDRAALDAAESRAVDAGGWCPSGRRAEDGTIPARYPLKETPNEAYEQRTAWNVRDSDGTLIITQGTMEGGTKLTAKEARDRQKPLLHVKTSDPVPVEMIRAWMEDNNIRVLNVAGPRESEAEGIYEQARNILTRLLDAEMEEMT
jgi:hypothetical protein